jgi:hypothetical protein
MRNFLMLALPFLVGCTHAMHKVEGSQPATDIPAGVRVAIGSAEVKEGDEVNLYNRSCKQRVSPARGGNLDRTTCENLAVGKAKVLKVLDHDAAIIAPLGDFKIDATTVVEK